MWKQKKLQLIRASKKPACFNVNPIIIRMEIVLLMRYYVYDETNDTRHFDVVN